VEPVWKLDHGLRSGMIFWGARSKELVLGLPVAARMAAEFLVALDGCPVADAFDQPQERDFVPGRAAFSVALPEPCTSWAMHAEGGALTLLVKRTGMTAGAGRILKQPEPDEQIRQREPLLAERNGGLHQGVPVRWE